MMNELLRALARAIGPITVHLAGRRFVPIWAILRHRGRVSGRDYATPIAIRRTPDGFLVPLPFEGAQWPRNVLAGEGCTVRWKGRDYLTTEPVIVGPEARAEFTRIQRSVMGAVGMGRFLRLRVAEVG